MVAFPPSTQEKDATSREREREETMAEKKEEEEEGEEEEKGRSPSLARALIFVVSAVTSFLSSCCFHCCAVEALLYGFTSLSLGFKHGKAKRKFTLIAHELFGELLLSSYVWTSSLNISGTKETRD